MKFKIPLAVAVQTILREILIFRFNHVCFNRSKAMYFIFIFEAEHGFVSLLIHLESTKYLSSIGSRGYRHYQSGAGMNLPQSKPENFIQLPEPMQLRELNVIIFVQLLCKNHYAIQNRQIFVSTPDSRFKLQRSRALRNKLVNSSYLNIQHTG